MSDFDFEELDKAVNGALKSDSDTPKDAPAEKPNEQPVSSVERTAPAARRSSGRFMDVVHPSSDMRGAPTAFTRPTTPSNPIQSEESTTDEEVPSDDSTDSSENPVGEWSKPLESPFLTDAKVEKRPLGGLAPEPTQELLEAPEEELKLEAPDEPLLEASYPDPIDFAAQATTTPAEAEDTSMLDPEVTEVESNPEPELELTPEPVVEEVEVPAGPASITQQYTEQPSTNQESGSIYDTENYHQPLAHNGKKRSGAWAILWIFLLVILGAGAGVAFYFYVLPML